MIDGLNMNDLLEKAKEMQETMNKKKQEAASKTIDVSVGGGMISLSMNGNLELLSLKIDPEVVDKDDVDTLEDLVRAAVNEGIRQAKELGSTGLSDLLGDMKLPDFGNFGK
ncbi:MAG: YbaB/EbfC family nucleoid-associated protein [SAR324 cluster bacterium]|uniref:Nucleoid-associated protein COB67_11165 n=1 Tax=SAR324 cluster bacterium TaxID=2024889 RepID=A0A2A4SV17_9DELT|nr:MAG: YbaB/EbfC family nucleoid-associated protein [SAR324 cluster bacterium]